MNIHKCKLSYAPDLKPGDTYTCPDCSQEYVLRFDAGCVGWTYLEKD